MAHIAQKAESEGEKRNIDSVLQVSFIANNQIYDRIRKENIMCEAFFEIFKDEVAAKIAAAEALVREENEAKIREIEARIMSETEARIRETEARKALERELAELKKKLAN